MQLSQPDLISIIVTSYNWSEALCAVLSALNDQKDRFFEVLIADDGSRFEDIREIEAAMSQCRFSVQCIRQEDRGFRAAKIRNRAVAQAQGDYLIFLDGDCMPRSDFVSRHRNLAERGFWVSGNRILLSRQFTQEFLAQNKGHVLTHSVAYWGWQYLCGNINRCVPLWYWPFDYARKQHLKSWKGAKTCNLGVWKHDFMAVNGFDERYEGWGYEDSDLVIRLIYSSVHRKSGRFALPVFHLWHAGQSRDKECENQRHLKRRLTHKERRALLGVDQYCE